MSHATHANAALTPRARLRLARLIVDHGWPPARAAERYDPWSGSAARWWSTTAGCASLAFDFAERHRAALAEADGPPRQVRERISSMAVSGRLLSVTFEVREPVDLDPVRVVLAVKLTAK